MVLTFRTCVGKIYNISLDPEITVGQAKPIISDTTKVPLKIMKLTIHFKPLDDNMKIKDIVLPPGGLISVGNSIVRQAPNSVSNTLRRPVSLKSIQEIQATSAKDPSNFNDLVKQLSDMGYPEEACKKALRVSFYNIDRAGELLVNQNTKEILQKRAPPNSLKNTAQSMKTIPNPIPL